MATVIALKTTPRNVKLPARFVAPVINKQTAHPESRRWDNLRAHRIYNLYLLNQFMNTRKSLTLVTG